MSPTLDYTTKFLIWLQEFGTDCLGLVLMIFGKFPYQGVQHKISWWLALKNGRQCMVSMYHEEVVFTFKLKYLV